MGDEKNHVIVPPVIKTETASSDEVSYHTDIDRKSPQLFKRSSYYNECEPNERSLSLATEKFDIKKKQSNFSSGEYKTNKLNKKLYPFLFPDFEYVYKIFQSDESFKEKTNEVTVQGFELYLVETWALEREKTCLLPAYTGNPNNLVNCCQMFLPMEPSLWPSSYLRSYYQIMSKIGFLKYVMGKGYIFVADIHDLNLNHYQITNLILIPNGTTIRDVWNNFALNINLRELQCSGRSNSMFQMPSPSTIEKFYQLFKIPKKSLGSQVYDYYVDNDYDNNIPSSSNYSNRKINKYFIKMSTDVELLVYMIQTSLWFFDLYDENDIDGLLCKNTQRALLRWQKSFGAVYFPHLNQTLKTSITYNRINSNLITALLSLVMVIFFKLRKLNYFDNLNFECKKKDPFINPWLLFYGINAFEERLKEKKIKNDDNAAKSNWNSNSPEQSKFLNFYIIDKLFELTDDADTADLNQVKKVIKTTFKDFSVSKKGVKKVINKMGSRKSVDDLAFTSELTNSIEDFVDKINTHKDYFRNSETLLASTSINSRGSKDCYFEPEAFLETINLHEMEIENAFDKDDLYYSRGKEHSRQAVKVDFYRKIRFKLPKNISSILGYLWVEVSFPLNDYFKKSKNKEYDYGFYNRFVWFDYDACFDSQYKEIFVTEANRLVDDIELLKHSGKKKGLDRRDKIDDNLYLRQKMKKTLNETSKLKTAEIVERFRIHQFYSSFNDKSENKLDEISKELYDYYNYKYVEHNEISHNVLMSPKDKIYSKEKDEVNNTDLSLRQKSTSYMIDDTEDNDMSDNEISMFDLPVDGKLVDNRSRDHMKIYEKVQEEIIKTNLDVFLKKEIYNPEFEHELLRRATISNGEFMRIKSIDRPFLIRSQSFSLLEDSVADFGRNYTSASIGKHIKTSIEEFNEAEARISLRKKHDILEKIKMMNQELVAGCNRDFELLKTELFQRLQTNSTQVEKQKKQLDSSVSKYTYDSRLLKRKIENCIESQEIYEAKLGKLKEGLLQDAKSKGLQYLVQLCQDKIITLEDIKGVYNDNNNYLINKELAKVLLRLNDSTEPGEIVEALRRSRLHIYCNGTNQSVIISNILRFFLNIYHFIVLKFSLLMKKDKSLE